MYEEQHNQLDGQYTHTTGPPGAPLPPQKTAYTDRLLRFVGAVVSLSDEPTAAEREGGDGREPLPPRSELVVLLAAHLVELSGVEEAAARWRACQLLQALLDSCPPEVDLGDDVLEELQRALLERLEDAKPPVRAAAARALKRLPMAGEVRLCPAGLGRGGALFACVQQPAGCSA